MNQVNILLSSRFYLLIFLLYLEIKHTYAKYVLTEKQYAL